MFGVSINWLAVVLAAVASFAFGWIWHMVFGKAYAHLTKTKDKDMMKNMGKSMSVAMLISFIGALISAYFIATLSAVVGISSLAGLIELAFLGWAAFLASTTIANDYAWQSKPFALHLLNALFWLGDLIVIVLVLFYLS